LNSAIQFQSRMHEVFKELIFDKIIIWIDDLLGHASTLDLWFVILTRVLELATHFNIKFNIEKCFLLQQSSIVGGCSLQREFLMTQRELMPW
jgi:hypothetical protein